MFGKLRLPRERVDGRQLQSYRAHFCASCHAQREVTGRLGALLTNYDQTLLALVVGGLLPASATELRPCTALPWRLVPVQVLPPAFRVLLAAGNLVLADAKLRDDVDDGGGLLPRLCRWLLRRRLRRAQQRLAAVGFPRSLVDELPASQGAAEAAPAPSLAELARPSAELLAQVFAHGGRLVGRADASRQLLQFGAALGRAVYAVDALEDHADDRRRGRFNAVDAVARQHGLAAAVAGARQLVQQAGAEVLAVAAALLPPASAAMCRATVQRLEARAAAAAARLRPPPLLAQRRAEAGDCDLPCDACGDAGCCHADCGDAAVCSDVGDGCTAPCDCCLWWPGASQRRQQRRAARKAAAAGGDAAAQQAAQVAAAVEQQLQQLVGRTAVAVTALERRGRVAIDGVEFDAIAESYTPRGRTLRVTGVEDGALRVR